MKNIKHLFLLPVLLLFAVTPLFSQVQQSKFHIASFDENPHDMSPKTNERRDADGEPYAIIKVTSNNPDDNLAAYTFDFENIPHIVEVKDDELWVYVGRNAKFVNIKRDGYRSIRKYDLGLTIQSGRAYEMHLSVEAPTVYKQILHFKVQPASSEATIMLKAQKSGAQMENFGTIDKDGIIARPIELGTYTYTVVSDKYHNSEGRIVLNKRNGTHIEEVLLRPNFSNITFKAAPGVEIYINDEKVGVERWSGDLKSGVYSVECRKPKHKSVVEMIKIEESNDRVIELRSPVPITGVMVVTSAPSGATVNVDGKYRGKTPMFIDSLLIGSHKVELSMPNYKSETTTVEIRENETAECNVTLSDIARMRIESSPSGADLYIDNRKVGATPYEKSMPSGYYNVRLSKNGYQDFSKRVYLSSSKPRVKFTLKQQYQKKFSGHIEAAGQFGSLMGWGANVGCYLSNFNIEAYYTYGIKKDTVYVNVPHNGASYEETPSAAAYGVKMGYGFILGRRFRLTPQIGIGTVSVTSDNLTSSAITASAGMRCECVLLGHLGVSFTPEYTFAVSKKDVLKQLETISSDVKGFVSGFNARVGLFIYF